jgi:hypothetical protein
LIFLARACVCVALTTAAVTALMCRGHGNTTEGGTHLAALICASRTLIGIVSLDLAGGHLEAPAWLAGIGLTPSFFKSPVSNSGNCSINGVIIKRLPPAAERYDVINSDRNIGKFREAI